jgi:hypothetical protein
MATIARHIIETPNDFAALPIVRAAAWADAMHSRGCAVNLDSMAFNLLDTHRVTINPQAIASTRKQIETALTDNSACTPVQQARISQTVRAIAQEKGYHLGPYGGAA